MFFVLCLVVGLVVVLVVYYDFVTRAGVRSGGWSGGAWILDQMFSQTIDSLFHTFFIQSCQNQKILWNRSNHKLQTTGDHHSTQLDEIWLTVLSKASLTPFSSKKSTIKKPHETSQIVSYKQMGTTIRDNSTRAETWRCKQKHGAVNKHARAKLGPKINQKKKIQKNQFFFKKTLLIETLWG